MLSRFCVCRFTQAKKITLFCTSEQEFLFFSDWTHTHTHTHTHTPHYHSFLRKKWVIYHSTNCGAQWSVHTYTHRRIHIHTLNPGPVRFVCCFFLLFFPFSPLHPSIPTHTLVWHTHTVVTRVHIHTHAHIHTTHTTHTHTHTHTHTQAHSETHKTNRFVRRNSSPDQNACAFSRLPRQSKWTAYLLRNHYRSGTSCTLAEHQSSATQGELQTNSNSLDLRKSTHTHTYTHNQRTQQTHTKVSNTHKHTHTRNTSFFHQFFPLSPMRRSFPFNSTSRDPEKGSSVGTYPPPLHIFNVLRVCVCVCVCVERNVPT